MKIKVDAELCVATGSCESVCPEVFEMGDDSIAVVKVDIVPAEVEAACREAVASCPVEAIEIIEE